MPVNPSKDAHTGDLEIFLRGSLRYVPIVMGVVLYLVSFGIYLLLETIHARFPNTGNPQGGEMALAVIMTFLFIIGFLMCLVTSIAVKSVKLFIVTALLPCVICSVLHMRSGQRSDTGNRQRDIFMNDRSPGGRGISSVTAVTFRFSGGGQWTGRRR